MELKLRLFTGSVSDRLAALQHALDAFQRFLFATETEECFPFQVQQVLFTDQRRLAQITAAHGSIKHDTVQETEHLPHTASEVQSWIQQQWKFVPAFSGTVVQPLSFQIVKAAAAPTSLNGSWPSADRSLFVKSPNPGMPVTAVSKIKDYLDRHRYWPGVLLLLTAKEGVIVDLRVLDQKGPTELSGFTVAWVRKYWRLRPDVTGTYRVPVYYGWD